MIPFTRPKNCFILHGKPGMAIATISLLAAMACAPAFANDAADVTRLLRIGQHVEALSRADASLAKNPRDAQMRFLKGVILTEQNKPAEAIAIFTRLTEDYPNLPEPFNNLAVLYAAAGQYEKARASLDAAIRTNPSYATAYENLGDVHAKLARQAYDKALQLDSSNTAAQSKLTMVRGLVGNSTASPVSKPVQVATGPTATTQPQPAAPAAQTQSFIKQAPQATVPPVSAVKPEAKPEEKPVAKSEPNSEARMEAKRETKPERKGDPSAANREEVLATVNGWAKAWSAKNVKAYLDYYSDDFKTGGQSRKDWEQERRARIVDKQHISVKVESPKVSIAGPTATVRFRQIYASDRLSANSLKTLVLDRKRSGWRIVQETTGR